MQGLCRSCAEARVVKLQHCVRVCTTAFDIPSAYTIIKPYSPSQKEGKKRETLLHPDVATAVSQGEYAALTVCVALLPALLLCKRRGAHADA